jgi:hypothetical protein
MTNTRNTDPLTGLALDTTDMCTYMGNSLRSTCCAPTVAGRAYCEEHLWQVYQKGTARARRKKDERTAAAVWDLESCFNEAVEELISEGFDLT